MCDPISITMVALSTVMAAAQVGVQNSARKADNRIKAEAAELQNKAFAIKQDALASNLANKQLSAADAKIGKNLEAAKAGGLSAVNASVSNVSGLSVEAVLNDFDRQAGKATSTITQQLQLEKTAAGLDLQSNQVGNESALFNLRPIASNPASDALQIGGAAFGAFSASPSGRGLGKSKEKQKSPDGTIQGRTG